MRKRLLVCAGALLLAAASPAVAAASNEDMVAAARALGFLETPLRGTVQVGIVIDPNSPSAAESQNLLRLLGNGLQVGNITLMPQLVPLGEIERAYVKVLVLPEGFGEAAAQVSEVSRSRHMPCVTTDLAQVQSGRCLLGVQTKPKVQIAVNRAAANAAGVSFAGIFRMMITEY